MRSCAAALVLWLFSVAFAFADPSLFKRSDDLSYRDHPRQSAALLTAALPSTTSATERARIYWRLSRDTLNGADAQKADGATEELLLDTYKQGEAYADRAIADDPTNPKGYFWKAANMGRWGQTRGIMTALSLADPIRKLVTRAVALNPNAGDPWFVLGQLYEQVPGWPISFGNAVWAVSYGRKAIDARAAEVAAGIERDIPADYYVQLARHLQKRNWSEAERQREQSFEADKYNATSNVVEKNAYYEGVVQIPALSDRDEAIEICKRVIVQLESKGDLTMRERSDLKHARETLSQLRSS